ncbi:DNA-directed RNA polymerase II subunit RPB1-like isoform X6 [Lethenteron reissneri]|uniref:DNA-directed RNA polymerase II subunit RPB1-like isoform X6 n=1 Tax=Lethenteron reissneri TaxID=7753 RepID=UPI002AB73247|nr:DNA-directed RNA polymerase II subunit RPB1-like isoform X6 [Lethenteron reissneri]
MEPSVPVNAAAMAPEGTSHAPSVPSLLLTNPAAEEKLMIPSVPVNAAAMAPEGTSHAPTVPSLLLTNPDNHKLGSILHTSSVPEIALHTNNMIKHGKATNHPEKCYKVIHNFSSTSSSNQLSPSKSANDIATNHPERNYQVVHKYTSSSNKLSPSKSANDIATNHPERNYQVVHKYTSSSNQHSPSMSAIEFDKITSNLTSLVPRGVPSQAGRVSPVPSRLGPFWGP